ncbi:MAG: hypothetical protein H7061_14285 [Bdellovibrionaceae bacterium]|nr:hypothetical protein [Bdellovibrio sp.]
MTPQSTDNTHDGQQIDLKMGLFNAENLFLLFDQPIPPHFQKLSEPQWQKLSASVYENKPLQKCIAIANLIKENNPDVMMLCEVGGLESLKNFNELFLDAQYSVALIEGNSDRNIDVGFLIKKPQTFYFDLGTNKNRPLHYLYPHETTSLKTGYAVKAATQLFSRDCAELRLFTSDRSHPFMIVLLTHLKSRLDPERIDPGGTERRAAELRTTLQIYKELKLQFANVPILLAGDLNGFAGRPATDAEFALIYQETDLQDVFEVAGLSPEKRSTFYQIKNGQKVEGKQIDYCFIPSSIHASLNAKTCTAYLFKDEFGFALDIPTTLDAKSKLPSDHYPLFFNLEKLPVW